MIKTIQSIIQESINVKEVLLAKHVNTISKAVNIWIETYKKNGKLMFCGNGGSAADSQHIATELLVRLKHTASRPAMAAIALTTDTSLLTAAANDFGFDEIFSRQVQGIGKKDDLLVAFSTSGNSENVIKAVKEAKKMKIKTMGILGNNGGKLNPLVDLSIIVDHHDSGRIQESHIMIGHILCELTESYFYA